MTFAYGFGLGTRAGDDWLEVFYPAPRLAPAPGIAEALAKALGYTGGNAALAVDIGQIDPLARALADAGATEEADLVGGMRGDAVAAGRSLVACALETDEAPASVPEVYLKLHLLSHRLVKPHGTALDGLFRLLPNVAWTSEGAIAVDDLPARQRAARLAGRQLTVHAVDKFPRMLDYVCPPGVRIADGARVRLGAYIGEGTTVMHEGFVNFNAGTLGTGMVEGRISAGVTLGSGSDLGGGASTMGTLSGGGNVIISIGEGCLVGANAGVGIPLGDRCTVEAGLYLTAGTKVVVLDDAGAEVTTVKARELAGKSDLLFRRHSQSGRVECLTNKKAIELNDELHAHN